MSREREPFEQKPNMFGREPVAFMALIQTSIALAVGFGLELTNEQTATIMAFTAALLGFLTRQQVTPNEKVISREK